MANSCAGSARAECTGGGIGRLACCVRVGRAASDAVCLEEPRASPWSSDSRTTAVSPTATVLLRLAWGGEEGPAMPSVYSMGLHAGAGSRPVGAIIMRNDPPRGECHLSTHPPGWGQARLRGTSSAALAEAGVAWVIAQDALPAPGLLWVLPWPLEGELCLLQALTPRHVSQLHSTACRPGRCTRGSAASRPLLEEL